MEEILSKFKQSDYYTRCKLLGFTPTFYADAETIQKYGLISYQEIKIEDDSDDRCICHVNTDYFKDDVEDAYQDGSLYYVDDYGSERENIYIKNYFMTVKKIIIFNDKIKNLNIYTNMLMSLSVSSCNLYSKNFLSFPRYSWAVMVFDELNILNELSILNKIYLDRLILIHNSIVEGYPDKYFETIKMINMNNIRIQKTVLLINCTLLFTAYHKLNTEEDYSKFLSDYSKYKDRCELVFIKDSMHLDYSNTGFTHLANDFLLLDADSYNEYVY